MHITTQFLNWQTVLPALYWHKWQNFAITLFPSPSIAQSQTHPADSIRDVRRGTAFLTADNPQAAEVVTCKGHLGGGRGDGAHSTTGSSWAGQWSLPRWAWRRGAQDGASLENPLRGFGFSSPRLKGDECVCVEWKSCKSNPRNAISAYEGCALT